MTARDLLDWRAIETTKPGLVSAGEMGKLLQTRAQGIHLALDSMVKSPRSSSAWNAILSPSIPDFGESVNWAKKQLDIYLHATK